MIDLAISHIASQLNQALRRTYDLSEDVVVISNLVEQDGTMETNVDNKLVLFLINVEQDTTPLNPKSRYTRHASRTIESFPPVYLNLYLVIAAHFSGNNYAEGLKFLSNAISFFQRRPLMDHENTPDLDDRLEKLSLEIENLNLKDLSTLWSAITGKYLPSIIYKVRMVGFDADDVRFLSPVIERVEATVTN